MTAVGRFVSKSMFFLFLICCAGFALGVLSTYISPSWFWPLGYFGLASPFFLIFLILFLIYWLLTSNKKCIWPLLVLVLGGNTATNVFSISLKKESTNTKDAIKVMSYNVRNFELYDWDNNAGKRDIMFALIDKEQPDIICFQEFYDHPGGHTTLAGAAQKLGFNHTYFEVGVRARENQSFGAAIFSRFPIIAKQRILPNTKGKGNLAIQADIITNEDTIRVYNLHLASIRLEEDDYEYLDEIKEEGTKAANKKRSKQLVKKIREAFVQRSLQAGQIKREIRKSPYPAIIAGDFNDIPSSFTYRVIKKDLKDTHKSQHVGMGGTHTGVAPFLRIDYILTSPEFEIHAQKTIKKKISDHFPVVAEVSLK